MNWFPCFNAQSATVCLCMCGDVRVPCVTQSLAHSLTVGRSVSVGVVLQG